MVFFQRLNKGEGRKETEFRIIPAGQGFQPDQLTIAACTADYRLIEWFDPAFRNCVVDIVDNVLLASDVLFEASSYSR